MKTTRCSSCVLVCILVNGSTAKSDQSSTRTSIQSYIPTSCVSAHAISSILILIQLLIEQLQGIRFNTMDGRISMYVLLVCVWCSLDAGGLLMVVTAQPTVTAVILTPEADRKERGKVDMRCTATNLESNHIVEWRVEDPWTTLRWGGSTITANPRFIFHTINQEPNTVEQRFTIVDLHIDDIDDYVCAVREPTQVLDTFDTVTTARVSFSVFYFPGEAFPVCSTSGLLTVIAGAETNINCSSEHGNSAVEVEIATSTMTPRTTSKASSINNTIVLSSRLTLEVADNGVEFECSISSSYFPNMRRSCTMGPIKVLPNTDVVTGQTYSTPYLSSNATFSSEHTFESSSMSTDSPEHTSVNVNPWIIAFALSMILLVIFLIIAVRLLFEVVKLRRIHQHPNETQPKAPNDTYMDLQPTDDRSGGYTKPTIDQASVVQHVYYEPDSVSLDYSYVQPDIGLRH